MRILFFTTFFLLASTAVVFSQGTTRTIKIEIFPSGYEIVEISTEPGPDVFLEIPKVGKTISKNGYSCDLDSVGAVIRYGKLINNTKKDGIWTEVRWYGSQNCFLKNIVYKNGKEVGSTASTFTDLVKCTSPCGQSN